MLASLLSSPIVLGTSVAELVGLLALIPLVVMFYRNIECHHEGCHRIGRFPHGHLRLCHKHHPLVPNDGKITPKQINGVALIRDYHTTSLLEEIHYLAHTGREHPRVDLRKKSQQPVTPIKTASGS